MAVYKPKYRDQAGELVESKIWWYEFSLAGKRVRESANTPLKTITKEAEQDRRRELEKTLAGMPIEKREHRINSVAYLVKIYIDRYELDHRGRPNSITFAKGRLAHVTRLIGNARLPDLTEDAIRRYIKTRIAEKVSGRTINMELGELSRAIGKPWSVLWPKVRKLEERQDVGQALSPEQERRLLDTAASSPRWAMGSSMIRIALLTGMRIGEITSLAWGQVELDARVITVGRAKTAAGTGRQIPMNEDLFKLFTDHAVWFEGKFETPGPELFLFPFGSPAPSDPTRPTTTLKTVWGSIRKNARIDCRLHDLRHTAATKMAEAGVPESTMLAIMGHMSRKMLERYSHIRMAAKRTAVESLAAPKPEAPKSEEVPKVTPKVSGLSLVKRAVTA